MDRIVGGLEAQGYVLGVDFVAVDHLDGKGPRIEWLAKDKPRPSDAEIAAWAESYAPPPSDADRIAALEALLVEKNVVTAQEIAAKRGRAA